MPSTPNEVTQLLRAWTEGDRGAFDRLVPVVYAELHRLARHYMAQERPDHILQTTALVNEAYLRLVATEQIDWRNRAHFFGACANVMRRILVDWARKRQSLKRGAEIQPLELNEALIAEEPGVELVA